MTTPSRPSQRCRVVGGRSIVNGEGNGPNLGKIVLTQFLHPIRAGDASDSRAVWRCNATGTDLLQTFYGVGTQCDFLAEWLEVLPEDPVEPLVKETEKEIEE